MAVNVPGGQGVYVEKDGTVGYKKPHSGVLPEDAVGKGWKCVSPWFIVESLSFVIKLPDMPILDSRRQQPEPRTGT